MSRNDSHNRLGKAPSSERKVYGEEQNEHAKAVNPSCKDEDKTAGTDWGVSAEISKPRYTHLS